MCTSTLDETLNDFGLTFSYVPIKCDNTSVISVSNNLVQHSRTKHMEIRSHFLRVHAQKGILRLNLLEPNINLLLSSQNHLMRINLSILKDN